MSLLVTGSVAYDHIMTFPGHFKDHILPDKIHMLNVAFNIESLAIDFGGTAGNISYNLSLLNQAHTLHSVAGGDFDRYARRLHDLKINSNIKIIDDEHTAQAFITTDLADNQITAFHPGAMLKAEDHPIDNVPELAIVAPNEPNAMLSYARYFQDNQVPFIFDPGQAFNALSGGDLKTAAKNSKALTVNDYEWELWQNKTRLDAEATLELTEMIIITLGEKGARVITKKRDAIFPTYKVEKVVDPTGCGDAFRAGLLYSFQNVFDLEKTMRFANAVASFCAETQGTQNHAFSASELESRVSSLA